MKTALKASAELRNELGIILNVIDRLSGSLKKDTAVLDDAVSETVQRLKDMEQRVTAGDTEGFNRLKWLFTESDNEEKSNDTRAQSMTWR